MTDTESNVPSNEDKNEIDKGKSNSIFSQLNELTWDKIGEPKWFEKNRWIKFEEKVEEAGEHWSKPHVGILTLVNIEEFKNSLNNGLLLLDHEGDNFDEIISFLIVQLKINDVLDEEKRNELARILQKKYKGPTNLSKKASIRGSQVSLSKLDTKVVGETENLLDIETDGKTKFDSRFKKKIPVGSEVANILVAETELFSEKLTIFIRLQKTCVLSKFSEVKLPSRFIIMFFGPEHKKLKRYECGRVMGSLFSDSVFREVAYLAQDKRQLIEGVDEFIASALVIPPSEWNPDIRIDPPKELVPQRQPNILLGLNPDPNPPPCIEIHEKEVEDVHEMEGLNRTHRLFGGLIDDIKRKRKFYWSDYKDALHIQCVASFIFLYFACLTPIITFGGLLMKATDGYLGAIESIVAGCIVGVVYALFSGQPLTILGSTGPILVFESIIFKICDKLDWTYLSLRLWIGLWIMVFLLLMVMFDLSFLVKYITKFTEESFAMLIALIYIYQAIEKVLAMLADFPYNKGWTPDFVLNRTCVCVPPDNSTLMNTPKGDHLKRLLKFETPPLLPGYTNLTKSDINILNFIDWERISDGYFSWKTHDYKDICVDYGGHWIGNTCGKLYVPDIFFFSWLLMLGTFAMAFGLKKFRNSRIFPANVRLLISNFGVVISIFIFTLLDFVVGLHTPKLMVPSKFEPTLGYKERGWIAPIFGKNPWWVIFVAFPPALLATILVFMDQQITAVIVNRPRHKLQKSHGYHLDLLVVALLIGLNSIMGIPWFVAATVLSLNHVMSLKKESTNNAPGELPQFLGCREQRVTHLIIFVFVGLTVFLMPALKRIPMAVLYGVFLYMGFGPLGEMEFIQRIGLFFMSPKTRPDYKYLRYIPIIRVHIFTLIQILCLIALWTIKSVKILSIGFPIMVLAMCFIRKGLECCFSYRELELLDQPLPGSSNKNTSCCGGGNKDSDHNNDEESLQAKSNSDIKVTYPMITIEPPSTNMNEDF